MEPFDPDAELAAIRERMLQPLSREQQVAAELQLYLDLTAGLDRAKDLSLWTDDEWLAFARHMIRCVDYARDISAEDVAKAMNSPPLFPLPMPDALDTEC
jgi:hypothetical protein